MGRGQQDLGMCGLCGGEDVDPLPTRTPGILASLVLLLRELVERAGQCGSRRLWGLGCKVRVAAGCCSQGTFWLALQYHTHLF